MACLGWAPSSAHEGHAHKVMGTVCSVHENRLEVTSRDGKPHTVTLTGKTNVARGKTPGKASEIRPGQRVVVTGTQTKRKDGTTTLIATRIQLGVVRPVTEACPPE
jgi:hypothetical protein